MALTLGDNFSYGGSKPLDARLTYSTLADMKAVADSTMYNGCLAYCVATDKTYQWKSSNTVDPDTGKWREFTTGSSIEVDDEIDEESTNPVQNAVIAEALDAKQDAADKMTASDMDDVVTPLPSVMSRRFKYSTEEQVIGEWIDGKPVYQKTVDCGTLPNSTNKSVNHNISNIDKIINYNGIAYNNDGLVFHIPNTSTVNIKYGIETYVDKNIIYIVCGSDRSGYNAIYTLQYTKTTD